MSWNNVLDEPLFKNSLYLMLNGGLGAILGFVYWAIIAKFFSSYEVGVGAALISMMCFLGLISSLGIHISIIRFLPEEGEKEKSKLINSSFFLTGIVSLIVGGIFILNAPRFSSDFKFLVENDLYAIIFLLFVLVTAFILLQKQIFVSIRSPKSYLIQDTLMNILKIILVIAFLVTGAFGAFGIVSSWGISTFFFIILGFILIKKHLNGYSPRIEFKRNIMDKMAGYSILSFISELAQGIPLYILPLIVISVLGPRENAYFYLALKIVGVLFLIPHMVVLSLFAEGSHGQKQTRVLTVKTMKFVLILLIPSIIFLFIFGKWILSLFSVEYSKNAFDVLRIMVLIAIPLSINEIFITIKRIERNVRIPVYMYISIGVITAVTSYVFLKEFSIIGAGMGWLFGQSIVAIFAGGSLLKMFRR